MFSCVGVWCEGCGCFVVGCFRCEVACVFMVGWCLAFTLLVGNFAWCTCCFDS